jgi:UDP-N-acetylmuramoyl-L-alanyl-D-glutamate--2,6-diaminopimelate ligase
MLLSEILKSIPLAGDQSGGDPDIGGIVSDSRQVRPGYMFAAIAGSIADGAEYIDDALRRGAVAVVTERSISAGECRLRVGDVRLAFAHIAAVLNNNPSHKLQVAGVTGTNGKTTVAYMIRDVMRSSGSESGLIGTVAYEVGMRSISASRTTPDAATVQDLLKQMEAVGCKSAVLEVSSHALVQKRTAGVDFDVAVFTNLTHEHLDYHKTMEAYYEAKASLFRNLKPSAAAVINADDEWGRRLLAEDLPCMKISYTVGGSGDVAAEDVTVDADGCRFILKTGSGMVPVRLKLLGRHNVSNALACIAACGTLGVEAADAVKVLQDMESVCGRLEPVPVSREFSVYVDYAHTGDALEHALESVREITAGRVITVFGCGGDRDREKRPVMGRAASVLADIVVVTSDNPRSENPSDIIEDIMAGVDSSQAEVNSIEDRAEAINFAIKSARKGDGVLIAGKGHETYQECCGRRIHFDDHEIAMGVL